MINKLLKRFGYTHTSEITDEYLLNKFIESISDTDSLPKEDELKMFEELSAVDGFHDYLRNTCAEDMRRYFSSPSDEQRWVVKGAFNRTAYLQSRMSKPKEHKVKRMKNLRYAS